jgi:hypothetical protein
MEIGFAMDVAVSGAHAYVGDGWYHVKVINVADPSNPRVVGEVYTEGRVSDVAVAGTYAYVATTWPSSGLLVIDIRDPANPMIVGRIATGEAYGVAVSGTHAYVGAPSMVSR